MAAPRARRARGGVRASPVGRGHSKSRRWGEVRRLRVWGVEGAEAGGAAAGAAGEGGRGQGPRGMSVVAEAVLSMEEVLLMRQSVLGVINHPCTSPARSRLQWPCK
jgi:hypothetical protein